MDLLQTYPSQILRGLAKRPEAEWHFGRLYLVGALTGDQYEAACYLDRVTRTYEKMLMKYGHLRASNMERTGGASQEDLSQSAQKKYQRAKRRHDEIYTILAQCGTAVCTAIVDALRKETKTDLELIHRGLTVITVGLHLKRRSH